MIRVPFVLLLAAVASPGPWLAPHGAGQPSGSSRVTLPQSAAPPGGGAAVPVQIGAAEGVQIGSLTLTLRFAAGQLTFDRVEMGGLGEAVGATAEATVETSGGESRLEITIATPEAASARAALPDGPIAQLLFTVADRLEAETVIPLKAQASAVSAKTGQPVDVTIVDGEIIVSNPSVVGCFFYMH